MVEVTRLETYALQALAAKWQRLARACEADQRGAQAESLTADEREDHYESVGVAAGREQSFAACARELLDLVGEQ